MPACGAEEGMSRFRKVDDDTVNPQGVFWILTEGARKAQEIFSAQAIRSLDLVQKRARNPVETPASAADICEAAAPSGRRDIGKNSCKYFVGKLQK